MRSINKNIPYYIACAALFILLKIAFRLADTHSLIFLLKPTDALAGLLTGSSSVYLAGKGYYHESLNIIIEKSCSGFNFWILCFIVFVYLSLDYLDKPLQKIAAFPAALCGAYLLAIFANSSRIFASVAVRNQTINIFPNHQYLMHEAIGIITYLSFLVLVYCSIKKFLERGENHEKPV